MTLLQFITDPETGKPKKNAISRCSEILGVHRNWLHKYLNGEWEPGIEFQRKAQDIVHSGKEFKRKRKTPEPLGIWMNHQKKQNADILERAGNEILAIAEKLRR